MHYSAHAAMAQKIHALACRTEPQARDVFDLNLLLARSDAENVALSESQKAWIPDAIDHASSISYDEYASKVVAYLGAEHADLFVGRSVWDAMQQSVTARLEALR